MIETGPKPRGRKPKFNKTQWIEFLELVKVMRRDSYPEYMIRDKSGVRHVVKGVDCSGCPNCNDGWIRKPIAESTWYLWKAQYLADGSLNPKYKPDFVEALEEGNKQCTDYVEHKSISIATGHFIEEEETHIRGAKRVPHVLETMGGIPTIYCKGCDRCTKGWIIEGGVVEIKKIKKYIPANGSVILKHLTKRKPKVYGDHPEAEDNKGKEEIRRLENNIKGIIEGG